ncbi:MAG: hypothetical protein ACK5QT_05060, partial [Oligoflexia bacterium]
MALVAILLIHSAQAAPPLTQGSCQSASTEITFPGFDLKSLDEDRFPVNEEACKKLPAEQVSDSRIKEIIKAALKPYLRKTSRESHFYHWGHRQKRWPGGVDMLSPDGSFDGPLEPDAQGLAFNYFKSQAKGHLESTKQRGHISGNGLYAASDPFNSIRFASDDGDPNNPDPPLLIRISAPKGTVYADYRYSKHVTLASQSDGQAVWCYLISLCPDEQCRANFADSVADRKRRSKTGPNAPSFLEMSWQTFEPKFFLMNHERTLAIMREVYKELQVDFIFQSWGSPDFYPETPKEIPFLGRRTGAPVFINPTPYSKIGIEALALKLDDKPSAEKLKLYREVVERFDLVDLEFYRKQREIKQDLEENIKNTEDQFWRFYTAWAPAVHGLPK